ncbi:MAG: hypothetical protein GF353_14855, partial [Candidatus Lokiarchaeota archaeon]|nr:hypothetical protein [Candidatus Lokiarchaeota archaeon]
MLYIIRFFSIMLMLSSFTILSAQNIDSLTQKLENEYELIDNIRAEKGKLTSIQKSNLIRAKQNILQIKYKLQSVQNDLDNPIYFKNDVELDNNLDLVDFYVYEFSGNSYEVFARLKNKERKYLEWVKLRFNLYNNGNFVFTDDAYIDYESYGYNGISPYKYSFIYTFIDKTDFDSISFQIEYDIEDGEDDILWDQILELESVVINPSGNYYKWQGVVENNFNYSMTFPSIYACIIKNG